MKKLFLICAVLVMALSANAQTNQYFWYQGMLMMGNPIAQIDSVTFGEGEPVDTLHIMLPRTIIKTNEVHDTTYITIHDTIFVPVYDTTYIIVHDTICPNTLIEGSLSGLFSVAVDKQVYFSQGNLQYQASTQTWRFAENQYDVIGFDNSNIANDYNGWIDLFGWGTGNTPTNWSTDYVNYSTFIDWGTNVICNGGNETNMWRTLTKDEWIFLFDTRSNAANLFGLGSVNGVNGTIILPDNWTTPENISFTPSTSQGLINQGFYYSNSNNDNFMHNTYTAEQWSIMEQSGAVFLPCGGYRTTTEGLQGVHTYGNYWSATYLDFDGATRAYYLDFYKNTLLPQNSYYRGFGRSVRLVR